MDVSADTIFFLIRSSELIVHVFVVGFAAESKVSCKRYAGVNVPIPIPLVLIDENCAAFAVFTPS